MAGTVLRKTGMPAISAPDARLFILGSLPGDASLAAGRYYAHRTNQFWRLLGGAIGETLQELSYEDRLARLRERRIGLWDVVQSAERQGSLDQAIRSAGHNPVQELLDRHADLQAVAFNGKAAAAAGHRLLGDSGLTLVDLPSSSAANTQSYAAKAAIWAQLGRFAAT